MMTMAFKMRTYVKTAHQMLKTNKQTNPEDSKEDFLGSLSFNIKLKRGSDRAQEM